MLRLPGFLRDTRRRRTIRTYLVKLRPLLAERISASDHYSPEQVTETVQEIALPPDEMHAACAIACTPEAYACSIGDDYWAVRVEIGAMFFGGNAGFTAQDAARFIKPKREIPDDIGQCFP